MSNIIQNFNFTVQEATGVEEENLTLEIPDVQNTYPEDYQQSVQEMLENYETFDGKYSTYYMDSEVWLYNSDSQIMDNQNIADPVRKDSNTAVIYDTYTNDFITNSNKNQIIQKIYLEQLPIKIESDQHIEKIKIKPNKNHLDFKTNDVFDIQKWFTYVGELLKKNSYISYCFSQSIPYNRDNFKDKNMDFVDYVDIISKYNFYDKETEEYSKETDIPNIYSILQSNKEQDKKIDLKNITDIREYNKQKNKYNLNTSKIIFSRDSYRNFLKEVETYNSSYAMQNDILISSYYEMFLQRIFDKVDLTQYVAQNYDLSDDSYNIPLKTFTYEKDDLFGTQINKSYKTENTKVIPFFNVLNNIETKDDEVIFGEVQDIKKMKDVLKQIILAKTSQDYGKYKRSLGQIYSSKPCYSETLLYRIKKYRKNTNTKVQDIYIPNLAKTELKYIDTQVKYDTEYRYEINSYSLIYASCYTYFLSGELSEEVTLDVLIQPSLVIAEVPYYSEDCFIIDYPPVHPFASFYSYKDVDDRILINFQQNSGIYEKLPIIFNPNELEKIKKIRRFLKREEIGTKIIYKSDDSISKFELFRTDVAPKTVRSFQNRVEIDTKKATSFVDKILPNKKYYYTFRSIDVHNNFSDVSPIYEVELKSINGVIYLKIDIYKITPENIDNPITFRRYLYIDGSLRQTLLNFEKSGLQYLSPTGEIIDGKTPKELDTSPKYGRDKGPLVANNSIFDGGKKFKVRIKSINSGKKFDILLNFDTKHTK